MEYARTFFASQFTYFNYLNEEWANSRLLPLFTAQDADLFKQAWDGFLSWGKLTPKIIDLMKPAFFAAVPRLTDRVTRERHRFIDLYEACFFWSVDDPLIEWIPQFFAYADDADKQSLTSQIRHSLMGIKKPDQKRIWVGWLARYWENRIQGVPSPLTEREVEGMLEWLPELTDVFPEAVDIAVRMPKPRLEHPLLIFRLRKEESDIAQKYPTAVAQLLIYLLDCPEHGSTFYNVEDLLRNMKPSEIDPTVKRELIEKLTAKGINASPLQTASLQA